MRLMIWNDLTSDEQGRALARPRERIRRSVRGAVRKIVDDVERRGWRALCRHSVRLDGRAPEQILVAPHALAARSLLSRGEVEALRLAAANIRKFHEGARPADVRVAPMPGLDIRKLWRPIDRIGLYVPGGETPLFSTLLMLAIPARIAGVRNIAVMTPPRRDGALDPALALAAEICGIKAIWSVGGAQAIAALAFGAGGIEPVHKICGPGNAYVNGAKLYVAQRPGGPAIDMPAGPSEIMVIADESSDAKLVAADLLSQAEHDPAAQVLLVTSSRQLAEQVEKCVAAQMVDLPRARIAARVMERAPVILVGSLERAVEIANCYAPEHLSLAVRQPDRLLDGIRNAGAIFVGRHAAESLGDYVGGSSHVLPTDGAARAWSGVSVDTFMKAMTVQLVGDEAARELAATAATLARLEGLEAHARAAELRGPDGERAAA